MTAADTTNFEQVALTGNEIIIAHNTGGGAATVTITSVADSTHGRVGHITADPIAAGEIRTYGPFKLDGWRQTDGYLYLQASATTVKFGVITVR